MGKVSSARRNPRRRPLFQLEPDGVILGCLAERSPCSANVGPYRIERRLVPRREVFVARRHRPAIPKRALKQILPQHCEIRTVGMFVDRRDCRKLEHPSIVRLTGEHDGVLFMMEMVTGRPSGGSAGIDGANRPSARRCIGDAVQRMGRESVDRPSHDPANLLLDRSGRVKLTVFGIARCKPVPHRRATSEASSIHVARAGGR